MDEQTSTDEQTAEDEFKLHIDFQHASDVATHWTNRYLVQREGDVFIISFYELLPPILLSKAREERRVEVARLGGVIHPKGVARVLVPAEKMEDLIDIMTKQLDEYRADRAKGDTDVQSDSSGGI